MDRSAHRHRETRLSPDPNLRRFFKGTTNCLSALVAAERYEDVLVLLELVPYEMWQYRQYGVEALAAKGKKAEAIRHAETGRGLDDARSRSRKLASGCSSRRRGSPRRRTRASTTTHSRSRAAPHVTRGRSCAQHATIRTSSPHSLSAREFYPCTGSCRRYGSEIAGADVWEAYRATLDAAERQGRGAEVKERVCKLIAAEPAGGFVRKVLGRALGL